MKKLTGLKYAVLTCLVCFLATGLAFAKAEGVEVPEVAEVDAPDVAVPEVPEAPEVDAAVVAAPEVPEAPEADAAEVAAAEIPEVEAA